MRLLMCFLLLGGPLLGQETPPPKETPAAPDVSIKPPQKPLPEWQKRALEEALKNRLQELRQRQAPVEPGGAITLAPGQACSIPLLNVLPPNPPKGEPGRIQVFPLPSPGRFPIWNVPLPAPSCDDVKR